MSTPRNNTNQIPGDLPRDIEDHLALYFDNQATPEVIDAIQHWLVEDPANARIFAEFGSIERMIYQNQKSEDASAIFALLAEIEDNAEPEIVVLADKHPLASKPSRKIDSDPLSTRDVFSAIAYLLRQALVSRPALYAYAAAVVLLVGALLIPWGDANPTPQTAQTNTPPKPAASAQPTPRGSTPTPQTVATLTATQNASWAERALAHGSLQAGSKLHPGDKLTLTTGFAEITTTRGAVAILEAPTTIELLNNNALRLHAGKLVGLCETESSKGFIVRTPTAEVTDLGTQFGVEVSELDKTAVQVFEGEVVLRAGDRAAKDWPAVHLATRQSRVVLADGRIQADAQSTEHPLFVRTMPTDAYSQAVLTDHPVLYWRFDDVADGVIANLGSEPSLVGQAVGAVTQQVGVQGLGLRFNGTEQAYVQSARDLFGEAQSTYTLELWVKSDRVGHSRAATCLARPGAQQSSLIQHFAIELLGDMHWLESSSLKDHATPQSLRAFYRGSTDRDIEDSTNLWPVVQYKPDRWLLLTAVVTPQSVSLYCNGERVSQAQHLDPLEDPIDLVLGNGIWVGRSGTLADRTFTGVIDEVAVYDAALDADRIAKRYELGLKTSRSE